MSDSIALLALYMALLLGLSVPLGAYMARVYDGEARWAQRLLGPVERALYRAAGVDPAQGMGWKTYAASVLGFNLLGALALYALQRLQAWLPLNPDALPAVPPELAFNTAVSFASNTNWQSYGGETTLSHLTQMAGLGVQNFVSAATGMAVLAALVRGLRGAEQETLGNFWADLTRSTLYILLPLSLALGVFLLGQGVVQSFAPAAQVPLLEPFVGPDGAQVVEQRLALGPVASQEAIKQLGTNGGGFFNANSAHPFENPTPWSNLAELLAILLIPSALCATFGQMLKDRRQGWAVWAAMAALFVPLVLLTMWAEHAGNPLLAALGVDMGAGNMEGKEARFGVGPSALWAVATTAASNGSVNAMHDSFTPLGGLAPMWLMQLGEVVFGGVGSGLYGMLVYVILAVFLSGLMVGRTPEYLGKKIGAAEVKLAALVLLLPSACVLLGSALACATEAGTAPLGNPGAHGFSEILYAFSSASNNNGSAFGGLTASGRFYATALGLCMLVGRYWVIVPVLALAGSLARKKRAPEGPGTLATHGPLFVLLLVGTVALVGALTFLPALALGPVVEHLTLYPQPSQGGPR